MSSLGGFSRFGSRARFLSHERKRSSAGGGQALRVFAIALSAATLAACTQTPFTERQRVSVASTWEAAPEPEWRERRVTAIRRAAVATKRRTVLATRKPAASKPAASTRDAAQGLASYYQFDGRRTASGEKFASGELTAAHRTLPFGTRLRVTNVTTGQSVTVRVNDRGPFIPGRVVDVSHSAAEALGMTQQGVAKVKLDVVQ
jgi:rare lipoprotein A